MDLVKVERLKEIYKLCEERFEPRPKYTWLLPLKSEVNVCNSRIHNNIRALYVNEQKEIIAIVGCLDIDLRSFREDIQDQVIQSALDWVPQSIKTIYEKQKS